MTDEVKEDTAAEEPAASNQPRATCHYSDPAQAHRMVVYPSWSMLLLSISTVALTVLLTGIQSPSLLAQQTEDTSTDANAVYATESNSVVPNHPVADIAPDTPPTETPPEQSAHEETATNSNASGPLVMRLPEGNNYRPPEGATLCAQVTDTTNTQGEVVRSAVVDLCEGAALNDLSQVMADYGADCSSISDSVEQHIRSNNAPAAGIAELIVTTAGTEAGTICP